MICRDDLPPTPDWIPESRDGLSHPLKKQLSEALSESDAMWATWDGDNG